MSLSIIRFQERRAVIAAAIISYLHVDRAMSRRITAPLRSIAGSSLNYCKPPDASCSMAKVADMESI